MPANLPNSPNAQTMQGPDPTGQLGYPIATVPATGADPTPVTIAAGGGAVTIADGADVNQGATTDAANTTGATGTMSGKLRGILAILANVWDSTLTALRTHMWFQTVTNTADVQVGSTAWPVHTAGTVRVTMQTAKYCRAAFTNSGSVGLSLGEGHEVKQLLASAARTTAQSTTLQQVVERKGCRVFLNVTAVPAVPGAGGLTVIIEARAPTPLTFQPILTAAVAVQAAGLYTYVVYPGQAAGGDTQFVSAHMGTNYRVRVAVGDAQSYTYSLDIDELK